MGSVTSCHLQGEWKHSQHKSADAKRDVKGGGATQPMAHTDLHAKGRTAWH